MRQKNVVDRINVHYRTDNDQSLDNQRSKQPAADSAVVPVQDNGCEKAEKPEEEEWILMKVAERLKMPNISKVRLNRFGRRCAPKWIDHHHLKHVTANAERNV